jgi:nucleolar protein 58
MLVLFETAAGFAIFKVLNEGKIKEATDLYEDFKTVNSAKKM